MPVAYLAWNFVGFFLFISFVCVYDFGRLMRMDNVQVTISVLFMCRQARQRPCYVVCLGSGKAGKLVGRGQKTRSPETLMGWPCRKLVQWNAVARLESSHIVSIPRHYNAIYSSMGKYLLTPHSSNFFFSKSKFLFMVFGGISGFVIAHDYCHLLIMHFQY